MRTKQYKARKKPSKVEEDAHAAICQYLKMVYPDVIFTSDASGLRLAMGLRKRYARLKSEKGIPDLLIFEPRGGYSGLFLEIKRADDNTVFSKVDGSLLKNNHVLEQAAILDRLKHKGYATYFTIGTANGIEIIEEYMKRDSTIHAQNNILTCPDCSDLGWIDNEDGTRSTCHCHLT